MLVDRHLLEHRWHGPPPEAAPTLVFLHDGLGCVATWRDFPARLAEATGCGALIYSRQGYGASDPVALPRPLRYMHDEGLQVLPSLLAAFSLRDVILIGHSDGASIALVYAGSAPRPDLRALVLEAPHVFCEEVCVQRIAADRESFAALEPRLRRHHGANTECAFWGWNSAWLDPGFREWNLSEYLPQLRVPSLLLQGADDEYGTLAQLDTIERLSGAPVERRVLASCRHSPHKDQPAQTLEAMTRFVLASL